MAGVHVREAGQDEPKEVVNHVERHEREARLERHGLLIFLGQIIGIAAVPLVDTGHHAVPAVYVILSLTIAISTIWILGYQRLTAILIVASLLAGLWFQLGLAEQTALRPPPVLMFLLVEVFCVVVCIRQAFRAGVPSTQRIYCGAASFIMLGVAFAAIHLFVDNFGLGHYALPAEFEGSRQIRWVDFFWFSFATLSTAGYSDLVPVGSLPLTIATIEGLSGLLFPATLIARIASLPTERSD
jgi:hypothetical protein